MKGRNFDTSPLLENLKADPELVVIVPRTGYFTANGQTKAWAVPESLTDDDAFDVIDTMKNS